jgi:hypothetical protein
MKDNEPSVSPSFATCPRVICEVVQWHAIEHAFLRHGAFARYFDFPKRNFASLSAFQVFWRWVRHFGLLGRPSIVLKSSLTA